jgi:hypothetical protein
MNWLTDWKRKNVEIAWEYSVNGILWRLLPSDNGYLILEDRDVEAKSVSFACIRSSTGEVCWDNIRFGEQWWMSIEAVHGNFVFLHEYATPDMPDHKKITVVDLVSGDILWSNDELKFMFAYEQSMYVLKDEYDIRHFFEVDLQNGEVLREIDDQYLAVLRETVSGNKVDHIEFPMTFNNETVPDALVKSIVVLTEHVDNIGLIEYLEKGEFFVVSYYENISPVLTKQLFRQHLAVLHKEKNRIVHKDVLTSDALMNVPDTFFGLGDAVLYIKNKKTLMSINLLSGPGVRGKN